MAGEEILTEDFARFELSALCVRAVGGDADRLERINEAEAEWHFGADDNEADVIVLRELDDAFDVFDADVVAIDFGGDATIARCRDDALDERAL